MLINSKSSFGADLKILLPNLDQILTFQNKPFSFVIDNKFTGLLGDIWTGIEKSMGVQSRMHLGTQYGAAPDQNGQWKGMIGMVHRNEVDVAVADFFPTPLRQNVVDFTAPILRTG